MAKQYGVYVGTPKQASPMRPVDAAYENCDAAILVRDKVEVAAAAADTVQLAVLGWETILDPFECVFACDDLGAGGTIKIGDVTYPAAFANAVDTDAAALGRTTMLSAVDINNYYKPLWEMLGYATLAAAKLVGAQCELLLTRNTTAGAGTLVWQMKGQRRI